MKRFLDFGNCTVTGGTVNYHAGDSRHFELWGGKEEILLTLKHAPDFSGAKRLIVDVRNPQMTNEKLFVRFLSTHTGKTMEMNVALFPDTGALAVFETQYLNGQLFFPPLTKGTLKAHVIGDGMDPADVDLLQIGLGRGYSNERSLVVRSVYLTDEEIKYPAPECKTVDMLGQWIQKDWKGKVRSAEELHSMLSAEVVRYRDNGPDTLDRYGGWEGVRFKATGYFYVKKEGPRWYLVDPDGCMFFSTGVFGVYPGEPGWILGNEEQFEWLPDRDGDYAAAFTNAGDMELFRRKFSGMFADKTPLFSPAVANLIRVFGPAWYEKWSQITDARLHSWGINTLSMFSDPRYISSSGMPYVIMLKGFPITRKTVFREFPDVFAPEYEEKCREFAGQLKEYAEDRLLIGYFLNNEPTWGFIPDLNLAEKLLETGIHTYSLDALIEYLRQRYPDAAALGKAWRLPLESYDELRKPVIHAAQRSEAARKDLYDFTGIMLDRYAALPSKYAREAAPRHLNLGMRFAAINNDALLTTSKHFDVFSFNCYQASPLPVMEMLAEKIDKPMLVGEFHFGALDAGLPSPSLFQVDSQKSRGEAYARYIHSAATHANAVGAHYFAYNDQPLWGRYDGENYQFGFIDICNMPYPEFTNRVSDANRTVYDVITGRISPASGETIRL